jgi:hypothetical protein
MLVGDLPLMFYDKETDDQISKQRKQKHDQEFWNLHYAEDADYGNEDDEDAQEDEEDEEARQLREEARARLANQVGIYENIEHGPDEEYWEEYNEEYDGEEEGME